jgi:hypothetical protein
MWWTGNGRWSEFKVSATPIAAPPATYFEMVGFTSGYCGIQWIDSGTQAIIFSVWDGAYGKAEMVDKGVCNEVVQFGGEGTGTSCRVKLPPSRFGSVSGLPSNYMMTLNGTYEAHVTKRSCGNACTDMSMTLTDTAIGYTINLGTQRFHDNSNDHGAYAFVENWSEGWGQNCVSAGTRASYFSNPQALINGQWQQIRSGQFDANCLPENNEICTNYFGGVKNGKWLMSTGGDQYVGRPVNVKGGEFFTEHSFTLNL